MCHCIVGYDLIEIQSQLYPNLGILYVIDEVLIRNRRIYYGTWTKMWMSPLCLF